MPEAPIDVAFAVPGDIATPTGGYAYDRQVMARLAAFGVTPHLLTLPGSFPAPSADDLARTSKILAQVHPTTPILFDGLAYGALPAELLASITSPVIALVHHPLASETGLHPDRRAALLASERAALAAARAVITTSPATTRQLIAEYAVPADKISVAEPGTEAAPRAAGTGNPFQILAVGTVTPRKGYPVLIQALARLPHDNWRLDIVGSLRLDGAEANRVREAILRTGLRERISLVGVVTPAELACAYHRADLFVMPSLYEGYGMVLAEAQARGLAIVCTTGGAAADTVPEGAAIKVPPGNVEALANAIRRALDEPSLRQSLSDGSWSAGQKLPRWPDCVGKIAGIIRQVAREYST